MSTNSTSKILVLDPSPSNLNKILKKSNSLCASSGPFDFVLLLGDIFNTEAVPENLVPLSTPTFYNEGLNDIKEQLPKTENLNFLGKLGIHRFSNGLTLAYTTGNLSDISMTQINDVFNGHTVDILMTYHWPSAISTELKLSLFGNSKIDTVVRLTKPRYHFACGSENGKFFERAPIFWKDELRVTRFIGLGQHGSKERFHYAFNLNLDSSKDVENVDNGLLAKGENPFVVVKTKQVESSLSTDQSLKRQRSDNEEESNHTNVVPRKKVQKPFDPSQCFFCLSNPKIETHMIISIGEKCYMTVAKGPLTRPHKNVTRFSGHGIIIPVSHIPRLQDAKTLEEKLTVLETDTYKEIEKYKKAIVEMFQEINADFKVVFFEISRTKSVHHHVQFVPILSKYLDSKFDKSLEKLLQNNEKYPRNYRLSFKQLSDEELAQVQDTEEYMVMSIWGKDSKLNYVCVIENLDSQSVDLQFPRRVLAGVLNDFRRIYWDKCKQSKELETEECENFKELFKKFDFTL